MSLLQYNPSRCVRALSVNAVCNDCVNICPTGALSIIERLIGINHSQCVGCGGCVSVCPTEAMALDDFSATEFFFSFSSSEEKMISCQKNVPCIASLSDEHLITLSRMKGDLTLDIGHCDACEIGSKVLDTMQGRMERCNYLLEATESRGTIVSESIAYQEENAASEPDRRDFFKTFHMRGIQKVRYDFEKEIAKSTDEILTYTLDSTHTQSLRTKKITDRRKIFFTALKRTGTPSVFHVVDAEQIGFTSQKLLDEAKCTACEMCYRLCPTGALTSDMRNSKIDFDPFLCVKCHLCHDVCEPEAITLSSSYNLKEWFEPKVQNLVTFLVRRCDECDTLFSSVGGEKMCRRCRLEEEEARELWGI